MARKKLDALFIRVHENMPEHPKVEGLSDKAFRLLITSWCWAAKHRTDGHIPEASWAKRGTAKVRAELLAAGLVEPALVGGGVIVHDWDDWQRTSFEIETAQKKKREAGALGGHERWHVNQGIREPDCEHCRDSPVIGNRQRSP